MRDAGGVWPAVIHRCVQFLNERCRRRLPAVVRGRLASRAYPKYPISFAHSCFFRKKERKTYLQEYPVSLPHLLGIDNQAGIVRKNTRRLLVRIRRALACLPDAVSMNIVIFSAAAPPTRPRLPPRCAASRRCRPLSARPGPPPRPPPGHHGHGGRRRSLPSRRLYVPATSGSLRR